MASDGLGCDVRQHSHTSRIVPTLLSHHLGHPGDTRRQARSHSWPPPDVPVMLSTESQSSSSSRSSTPHVNAPCEPPPCSARLIRSGLLLCRRHSPCLIPSTRKGEQPTMPIRASRAVPTSCPTATHHIDSGPTSQPMSDKTASSQSSPGRSLSYLRKPIHRQSRTAPCDVRLSAVT